MKASPKRTKQMVATLVDLGILSKIGEGFKVDVDFDMVLRGLIIKRLKRIHGQGTKEQIKQAEIEALVDALIAYGFLNVSQKPRDIEFAVNCLMTFKKEAR